MKAAIILGLLGAGALLRHQGFLVWVGSAPANATEPGTLELVRLGWNDVVGKQIAPLHIGAADPMDEATAGDLKLRVQQLEGDLL